VVEKGILMEQAWSKPRGKAEIEAAFALLKVLGEVSEKLKSHI